MKHFKTVFLAFIFSALLFSAATFLSQNSLTEYNYSYNDNNIDETTFNQLYSSVYKIYCKHILSGKLNGTDVEVIIEDEALGTAFAIAQKDGMTFLLTAAHVVDYIKSLEISPPPPFLSDVVHLESKIIIFNGEEEVECRLLYSDIEKDISLLSCDDTNINFYGIFANADKTSVGNTIFSVGFPFGEEKFLSRGIISSNPDQDPIYLESQMVITPGCSGGPQFVINNGIAAIVSINSRRKIYEHSMSSGSKISNIFDILKEFGVEYRVI